MTALAGTLPGSALHSVKFPFIEAMVGAFVMVCIRKVIKEGEEDPIGPAKSGYFVE